MKSLKSILLHKMIAGYRISTRLKDTFPSQSEEIPRRELDSSDIENLSKKFKVPKSTIEGIANETKEIASKLQNPLESSEIADLKNKLRTVERNAVNMGVYIMPEVSGMISQAKERIGAMQPPGDYSQSDLDEEVEELEREKKMLEDAKRAVMEKYYNRELDESSIKEITDNYERRLVEADIKMKNKKDEMERFKKEGVLPQRRDRNYSPVATPAFMPSIQSSQVMQPSRPPVVLNFSKIFRGQSAMKTSVSGPQEGSQEIEVSAPPKDLPQLGGDSTPSKIRVKFAGIEIPEAPKTIRVESMDIGEEVNPISLTYPLIPKSPARNEPVFAYAKIFWDAKNNRHLYQVVEPQESDNLKEVYSKVKEMLEQRLDIDFSKLKKIEAKDFLEKQVDEVLQYFKSSLSDNEKRILKYYMERDFTGLEKLEPLIRDPNIEDISCDGIGIPIFIFHRNADVGSIATNVSFNSEEELDSFIIRLAQLCGKSISVSDPLLDGTLPDGSRIQATLGTDIARRGSNFTIRKFTEEPLTPVHLMNYGTLDANVLAYLWFIIDYGRSVLVSGGTASGKTSLLNVMSLFIRPEKKIVSIEDTAELRLPHPHWVPVVARTAISTEGKGEVDMFELLKESLRQRPDYIIVGEVRGKEAYVLFQQMATGHASLATIHAENVSRLADRLTTPPISLPAGLVSSLDTVVFLARMKYKNKFVRKVTEIVEIVGFDSQSNKPIVNQIYKWNPKSDKFEIVNSSVSLQKIADYTGIEEKEIRNEIQRRIVILEWMKENKILGYKDVHRIFSIYYTDPERLLSSIQGAG